MSAVFEAQRKDLRSKIGDLAANYICSVDETDLARSLADQYRIDVPVLDLSARTVEPREEKRQGRGDFGFFEYTVNVYSVRIPFAGVAEVIRNFTAFAETKAPDSIVNYLNQLWGKAVGIVNRHHGVVNKFLGDGFMAVFGAPLLMGNHCQNAINAARELVAEIKRATDAGEIPPTRIGIALHSGEALVGNIGSTERREYTVIGDVVNVAFRIEQLNKELNSSFLVSESVQETVGELEGVESSASVPIRGRNAPVRVYKLG